MVAVFEAPELVCCLENDVVSRDLPELDGWVPLINVGWSCLVELPQEVLKDIQKDRQNQTAF